MSSKKHRAKPNRRGEHPASLANLIPAGPGNQRARKHGGYARYHPPEIIERVTPGAPSPERLEHLIQAEEARLHSLFQTKARWDAKGEYSELVPGDYPLVEIRTSSEGTATKRERPDFERLIDRSMGRLSALIDQKERIAASPAHVATRLALVLDEAEAAGMSAVDTAERVERAGLAVPFSLQQRVRAELALAEPPEPEGGMTDDELERLSQQYAEQTAGEPDWLAERREQVQQIHDQRDKERQGS
ncbi:hypothetical protein ACFQH5_15105 [Halomonas salifodinae]|uniref:Terminase small subunit n=1 Tax=Halomonas salifodinae TaxID=438745 RepID=A0ABW2EY14_9GAMM